jgi:predicted ester cyclase
MSAEENKAQLQRVYEQVFNQGNLDQIEEFFSADFVDHEAPPPGMEGLEGIEVLRQFVKVSRDAFPDLQFTAEDMIVEGDKVAARYTMRPGDALQLHGEGVHGPHELVELPIRFLSVTAYSDRAADD